MQNTISCTHPVQNTAYCTVLAAFAEFLASVRNTARRGGGTRVSAIVEALTSRFKTSRRGVPRDYRRGVFARSAYAGERRLN